MADCGSSLGGHKSSTLLSPSPPRLFQRTAKNDRRSFSSTPGSGSTSPPLLQRRPQPRLPHCLLQHRVHRHPKMNFTSESFTDCTDNSSASSGQWQRIRRAQTCRAWGRIRVPGASATPGSPSGHAPPTLPPVHARPIRRGQNGLDLHGRVPPAGTRIFHSGPDRDRWPLPRTQGEEEDQATFATSTRHI